MCKEGSMSNFIYIIAEGEYEISKLRDKEWPIEDSWKNHRTSVSSLEILKENEKNKYLLNSNKKTDLIKLCLVSVGYVFGYDDIVANRAYSANLICSKNNSSVYRLNKAEFLKFF